MKVRASEEKHIKGARIRDIILGGQDGLVNVLGLVLGVATATNNPLVVIVAALAATFAETISMAAVAYTSSKAEKEFYLSEMRREQKEVEEIPDKEREEIKEIYRRKGFAGTLLNQVVKKITSNKKVWIDTMMMEELQIPPKTELNPMSSFVIVFFTTLVGSLIPTAPFLLLPVGQALIGTIIVSSIALFSLGVLKAKYTDSKMLRSGLESLAIGLVAAALGYVVGYLLGSLFGTAVAVA